jgi:hypothetical protein
MASWEIPYIQMKSDEHLTCKLLNGCKHGYKMDRYDIYNYIIEISST